MNANGTTYCALSYLVNFVRYASMLYAYAAPRPRGTPERLALKQRSTTCANVHPSSPLSELRNKQYGPDSMY